MKKILIAVIAIVISVVVYSMLTPSKCSKNVLTDHPPVTILEKDFPIQIIPTDTVDGRPTYTVLFSDSTAMDSMYAEEIGSSLATGVWGYDEDIKINKN